MILDLNQAIAKPLEATINGGEAWLKNIYSAFKTPEGQQNPLAFANVSCRLIEGEVFEARGQLKFCPFVPCSRCDISIPWEIEQDFAITILPTGAEWADAGSPDEIYYHENRKFNFEGFLNDQIHLAIPQQTITKNAEGRCGHCNVSLEGDKVFSSGDEEEAANNPFAALKDLDLN